MSWRYPFLAAALLFLANSAKASDCGNPSLAARGVIVVKETETKDLATIGAAARTNWTVEYQYDSSDDYPRGLVEFLHNALSFTGSANANHVCLGKSTCKLALITAIDLELIRDRWHRPSIKRTHVYKLSCWNLASGGGSRVPYQSTFRILVQDVNEFEPKLNTSQLQFSVPEGAARGTAVVTLEGKASDDDAGDRVNQFLLRPGASSLFAIRDVARGVVIVNSELDYEGLHREGKEVVKLGLQLVDKGGRTGTGTLTITITDVDDIPPAFSFECAAGRTNCTPTYTVIIPSTYSGHVRDIEPGGDIKARDGDALGYPVTYSLQSGPDKPPFQEYMDIATKGDHGEFIVLQPLAVYDPPAAIEVIIQATEMSKARRSATALLVINVTLAHYRPMSETKRSAILVLGATFGALLPVTIGLITMGFFQHRKKGRKAAGAEEGLAAAQDPVALPKIRSGQYLQSPVKSGTNESYSFAPESSAADGSSVVDSSVAELSVARVT